AVTVPAGTRVLYHGGENHRALGPVAIEQGKVRGRCHLLQAAWASRFTAGAAGFLLLIQCRERPDTYGEPSRLDTIPSKPSLQAWRKTMSPRSAMCSFNRTAQEALRISLASTPLPSSSCGRRRSLPPSLGRSKANSAASD